MGGGKLKREGERERGGGRGGGERESHIRGGKLKREGERERERETDRQR